MKFGALEVVQVNQIFSFSFDGPNGSRSLGSGNDLKGFVEGRLGSGMTSPALQEALLRLKELGDAHDWNLGKMGSATATAKG